MNAKSQVFELAVESRQANEAVLSLFHTILFHRTLGKFSYSANESFAIGTVGYTDVDCEDIDLTYVCCDSPSLDKVLRREVKSFSEQLQRNQANRVGQISLEFFQKRPGRWMFPAECIPWEVWTVYLELIPLNTVEQQQMLREKVGEVLAEKIFHITEVMNRQNEYLPKMPNMTEVDLIFDTSYRDVQPYLFNLKHSVSGPSSGITVKSTMKKLIKESFL
ncbi:autophagy-related protein 101 [Leptinotarsa decemlineata]|uniref:autophagy-related protein 101 n=1 Tax=Leptinotarsa decemlineata TaxID=7539 RepID=UPI000C253EEC|nr:autophagy-related protein 101 [Leptinotarsa decemlineata]